MTGNFLFQQITDTIRKLNNTIENAYQSDYKREKSSAIFAKEIRNIRPRRY